MAGTLDNYKRLFREATVSDHMRLFQLHIVIYLVVNIYLAGIEHDGNNKD